MKITVKYGEKWYGNDFDTDQFDVKIHDPRSHAKSLGVDFKFSKPVGGRGANWDNRGWVKGASLQLSVDEARKLAVAILWHLEENRGKDTHLQFGLKGETEAIEKIKGHTKIVPNSEKKVILLTRKK